jgi:hypothetical protein
MEGLTKETQRLLALLYNGYLSKRDSGMERYKARMFGDADDIVEAYMPESDAETVSDLCWVLSDAGYAVVVPGDDKVYAVQLTERALVKLENRFKDGAKSVLRFLAQFIP